MASTFNKVMEEQSTRFICIAYQGKHNGSVLLTNEWCVGANTLHTKCMGSTVNIAKNRPNL